jgi:hypothetical protein
MQLRSSPWKQYGVQNVNRLPLRKSVTRKLHAGAAISPGMLSGNQNPSAYGDLQADCISLPIHNPSNIKPEDGDGMFLQNVDIYLQDYAISQNTRVWTIGVV